MAFNIVVKLPEGKHQHLVREDGEIGNPVRFKTREEAQLQADQWTTRDERGWRYHVVVAPLEH